MNQTDLEVLSRFEEVWRRVQRSSAVSAEERDTGIKELMDSLCYQWNGCRQLAMCACGREKTCLLSLSEQIKKQYRLLQLHYFLKEGDVYFSDASPNFASYTPYNLRKLYKNAVNIAGLLQKAREEEWLPEAAAENMIAAHKNVLKGLLRECLR